MNPHPYSDQEPILYPETAPINDFNMKEKHPKSSLILAFSIVGILVLGVFSIISWIMSSKALKEIKNNQRYYEDGLLSTGRILSIIGSLIVFPLQIIAMSIIALFLIVFGPIVADPQLLEEYEACLVNNQGNEDYCFNIYERELRERFNENE